MQDNETMVVNNFQNSILEFVNGSIIENDALLDSLPDSSIINGTNLNSSTHSGMAKMVDFLKSSDKLKPTDASKYFVDSCFL